MKSKDLFEVIYELARKDISGIVISSRRYGCSDYTLCTITLDDGEREYVYCGKIRK